MQNKLLPKILALFVKALNKTIRKTIINSQMLEHYKKSHKSLIYAFWEGKQFLLFGCNSIDSNLAVLASASRDGALIRSVLKELNFHPVAGSSSRKAVSGLLGMIRTMQNGHNACFIVDGPRGPLHKVKPGVIYLANKTASTIIPITTRAKYRHVFKKSWCQYEIPFPFSKGVVIFGDPISIPADLDRIALEQKRLELETELQNITKIADNYYNKTVGARLSRP